MAEGNGAAQNKLGQLFVDIGVNGVGQALKSLNSVAATFLLGKNAANQFAQTLSQPFKEAGNAAVNIGKMSNALATSSLEYQKLAMHFQKYNLGENLISDVSKLEQTFYDLSQGFTNLQGSFAVGLQQLGLDAGNYKGTFKDTLKLIDDIQDKTSSMSKEKRNQIFRQLGISSDWGYLFDKGGRASDYYTIPDSAIKANQGLQESMNELKNTMDSLWQELLAEIAPALKTIADTLTEWLKHWGKDGGIKNTVETVAAASDEVAKVPYIVRSTLPVQSAIAGGAITAAKKIKKKKAQNGELTGGAADVFANINEILPDVGDGLPSGVTQNITNNISHDITINGDNAQEIAREIAGISEQDIQYSQYQSGNLPGI